MGAILKPLLVLVIALVVQVELFAELRILGVMPELLLGTTIAAAWVAGSERGAMVGFVAGLLYDLYLPTPFALTALTYVLVAHLVGLIGGAVADTSERLLRRMVSIAALAGGLVLFVTLGELLGQPNLYNGRFLKVVLVGSAYSMVFMPLLHRAMAWAFRAGDRATNAPLRVSVVE